MVVNLKSLMLKCFWLELLLDLFWFPNRNKKRKNNGDLLLSAKINNTNACFDLLDKKQGETRADVNAQDASNKWTSLHYACFNGNTKLVSQLLYYEAMIDSESVIS